MRSRAVRRPFGVLVFDGLGAAALADFLFFVADLGDEVGEQTHVGFEAERGRIYFGSDDVVDSQSGRFGTFGHDGGLLGFLGTTYYISEACASEYG